jgi:hypothetical protein
MKVTKTTWYIAGGCALAAVGAGIYFFVIRGKKAEHDKYGNLNTKSAANPVKGSQPIKSAPKSTAPSSIIKVEPDWVNPFDAAYAEDVKKWISPKPLVVLKDQFAHQYANELFQAKKGILGDDDEQAVFNVFGKKVKDKVHVSNVSRAFSTLHKKDLYAHLKSFLNESEMEKYVHLPVRNLVNYRVG